MNAVKNKKPRLFRLQRLPQDMARLVCAPLLLVYRMKRITPEGKPYKTKIRGGAIMSCNHQSFADPFLVGVAVWYRRLFFLAAEVVMQGKLRSWLLGGVGAIRIDRNATDLEAIRRCVDVLKQGYLLSVFPQGGIGQGQQVESLKAGAVLIALQAGVPIIPMYMEPKKKWYSRRVAVIGEPLDPKAYIQKKFPSAADMERVTEKLLEEMKRCAAHQ